jgi:molecular chaperone Hsp33
MGDDAPRRQPDDSLTDDIVLPFRTDRSGVIGRLVRLGPAVDSILSHHDVPEPVAHVLGEAVALTALLGKSLKFDGKLIVQTKTDGILDFLVINYEAPGRVRGYVRYDKKRFAEASQQDAIDAGDLLGTGHLAITIDPGEEMERYQGIVELSGTGLADAAHNYFRQSEQLPSFISLAVARHYQAGKWHWRAGGLMLQNLAREGGHQSEDEDQDEGDDEDTYLLVEEDDDDDDAWERTRILAGTVEDHELLDPTLEPERLLYRLFHEEGVRALPRSRIEAFCRCSRERVEAFLRSFGSGDLADMREADGSISVTCEFCAKTYRFASGELD